MKLEPLSREIDVFISELEREAENPYLGTDGLSVLVDKYLKLLREFMEGGKL